MPSAINNARRQVEALRIALLAPSPEPIEQCLPGLEEAVRSLTEAEAELRTGGAGGPELRRELIALNNELRVAGRLIEHGAEFYRGWAKLLGAATAGYLPTGEAASITGLLNGAGNLSVRG